MYKRRMMIFMAVTGIVMAVTLARLWQLQIVMGEAFRGAAEDELRNTISLPTIRGRILDRNDMFLAVERANYSFCLEYGFLIDDPEWRDQAVDGIRKAENLSEDRAREIYDRRADTTWRLARQLAREHGVNLELRRQAIVRYVDHLRESHRGDVAEQNQAHAVVRGLADPIDIDNTVGAEIQPGASRYYPYGDVACHIIGSIGRVTREHLHEYNLLPDEAEWRDWVRYNYHSDDSIGVSGVERLSEDLLRGRRGYRRTLRTAGGRIVVEEVAAIPGQDVRLTLDVALQEEIAAVFANMSDGHNGAIVVVSVPDGEILAMVSVPTYDLNAYRRDYTILANERVDLPLLHRAAGVRYPPGSTVKPLAALAGLAEGVITLETTFDCRGYLHTPDAFRCWIWRYGVGHGSLSVVDAMKHSCNVFMYNVGEHLGVPRLHRWYTAFGYRDPPGTGLSEEKAGKVLAGGGRGPSRFLAIGQGPVAVTPLHVANGMATVARGGTFLSLSLLREGGPAPVRRELGLSAEAIGAITTGMYQVVNAPGGTAYKAFHGQALTDLQVEPLSFDVCGKTGTAETPPQRVDSNGNGRIDRDDQIVREGDMAWFAGFAPRDNPKIAFAVVVEYVTEGGGAAIAAPIGREMLRLCQARGYVD